jgi:hypothetical protein
MSATFITPTKRIHTYPLGELVFRRITGQSERRWYIPITHDDGKPCLNAADYIFVDSLPDAIGGFDGAKVIFPLEDGDTAISAGPWHSNWEALLSDTGEDLRLAHLTFGCVARKITRAGNVNVGIEYGDLHHADDRPWTGAFDRIQVIAQQHALESLSPVYYYVETTGGSHRGTEVPPKDMENEV